MGFLDKRRARRAAHAEERREAAVAHVVRGVHDARSLYTSDGGEFDTRAMLADLLEGAPTDRLRLLRQIVEMRDQTADDLYDREFAAHWDGMTQDQRAGEIEKLARFVNTLAQSEGDGPDAEATLAGVDALVSTKVHVFSTAYDAVYADDYTERLFRDPAQFGTADFDQEPDGGSRTPGTDGDAFDRRDAAMSPAADRLDHEIENAPVDDYFVLMLLACAWGGFQALQVFANTVEQDLSDEADESVAALVSALESPGSAEACVRAAALLMVARVVALNWPDRPVEALDVARAAIPVDERDMRHLREQAELTVAATQGDNPAGSMLRRDRLALQWMVEKATGATDDMYDIPTVMSWAECWRFGIESFKDRMDELETNNPEIRQESQ